MQLHSPIFVPMAGKGLNLKATITAENLKGVKMVTNEVGVLLTLDKTECFIPYAMVINLVLDPEAPKATEAPKEE